MEKTVVSKPVSPRKTLTYYYLVGVISVTIGIVTVSLLNLFTPLQIIQHSNWEREQTVTVNNLLLVFLPSLLLLLSLTYGIISLGLRHLLKPIALCLKIEQEGKIPDDKQLYKAQVRLLNLHFMFARMNVLLWIVIPVMVGIGVVAMGHLDFKTATIFAARASMVGLIASSIASLKIEIASRKWLIPHFFPAGVLSQMEGVKRWSLSKRMMLSNRLGAFIPATILLITLLTIQWELENATVSAAEYGRELILFTLILTTWIILFSKQLSLLQNRNIVEPINDLVTRLKGIEKGEYDDKIQVTSNDEIGYAGEVVNTMTQGLKERLFMQRSLDLARQVQQNLLPQTNPTFPGLDIAGMSRYCDETGGDYYDFIDYSDSDSNKIGVVIGDVSGHGISSALLMATTRGFLRQRFALPGSLTEIVSDVNIQLTRDVNDSGNFMTLFLLTIDNEKKRLEWVRAGHDPAIIYDADTQTISELKGTGIVLGVDQDYQFEENRPLDLRSGQIILLGTDGIWEARNSKEELFGKDSIYTILEENSHRTSEEILDQITTALADFQQDVSAEDDVTCIVIKILPQE